MIVGKKELNLKLDKIADPATAEQALWRACVYVEAKAKEKAPEFSKELKNSITSKVVGLQGEVGSNLEYAVYIHQGTGIHARYGLGRPTPWSWPATAEEVERYGVMGANGDYVNVSYDSNGQAWIWTHGQEPNPFLEQALDESKPQLQKIFNQVIKEALND